MGMKEFALAFSIGAVLKNNFSTAFLTAGKQISSLADAQAMATHQAGSLKRAFEQGIISANSYANAMSKISKIKTGYAFQNFQAKGAEMVGAYQTLKSASSTMGNFIQPAISFEASMSKVGAIARASDDDMKLLTNTARRLGAQTQFSATQAADAMSYLGMAGWKSSEIIKGMPGLLSLAAAGGTDLARTADIVSDNLTAFGLSAEQSQKMADIYATVITRTNTNVEMLGETMKYAAPVAKAFGTSMEETAALAGIMANSGIKASQAGTSLRSGFLRLAGPPKMAQKAMDELGMSMNDITAEQKEAAMAMASLGISMSDSKGPKKMSTILTELRNKTKDLGNEEKLAAMKAIFGTNAATGWISVIDSGNDTFDNLVKELEKSDGAADKMAKRMQNNAHGAATRFNSAMESLSISVGNLFLPSLTKTGNVLAEFIGIASQNQWAINAAGAIGTITIGLSALNLAVKVGSFAYAGFQTVCSGWNTIANTSTGLLLRQRVALFAHNAAVMLSSAATKIYTATQWAWNIAMSAGNIGVHTAKIVLHKGVTLAASAATKAWAIAQWAWNAAMSANPLGLLIIGVSGLIAAGYALYTRWDEVKQFFATIWDSPTAKTLMFAAGPIGWIAGAGSTIIANWDIVKQWFITMWDAPGDVLQQFVDGIKNKFNDAFAWLKDKWRNIQNFLSTPIFGKVNVLAQNTVGNTPNIAQNATGGIYSKGAFITTFAENSGESAIPHTPNARNIGLLSKTNQIMGNPLGVGSGVNVYPQINIPNNTVFGPTFNPTIQPAAVNIMQSTERVMTPMVNNVFKPLVQSPPVNIQQRQAPSPFAILLEKLKPREERREQTNNGEINATFAPNITIQGNADEKKLRQVLDDEMAKFRRMLEELKNQQRRVSYA